MTPLRAGQRVRMLADYWYPNKGHEGVISHFTISPLDEETLGVWIRLDGDWRARPMPPSVFAVLPCQSATQC